MATVITLAGRGAQGSDIMNRWYNGFAHAPGNTWHNINYVSQADGVYGDGVGKLNTAINTLATPQIVIGHSLGAQIAGQWIRQYGVSQADKAATTSFILTGDPERRYGRPVWDVNGSGPTRYVPDNTAFTVKDVSRLGDGWANWPRAENIFNPDNPVLPNLWKITTAFMGMFTIHLLYSAVDLTTLPDDAVASAVVGNTTYYVVP